MFWVLSLLFANLELNDFDRKDVVKRSTRVALQLKLQKKKLTEISFGFRICSRVEVSSQLLDVQGLVDLGLDTLALENRVLLQGLAANDVPAVKLLGKNIGLKYVGKQKKHSRVMQMAKSCQEGRIASKGRRSGLKGLRFETQRQQRFIAAETLIKILLI